MSDFLMPSLGADMEAGTLLEWHVKPGDAVKRGDIVALVDTSKAEIEVEIFEDGIVDKLLVPEGARVPVGTVLATLRATAPEAEEPSAPGRAAAASPPAQEAASPPAQEAPPPPAQEAPSAPPQEPVAVRHAGEVHAAPPVPPPSPAEHRPRISPVARRAAERMGVDVSALTGTGPRGAITLADIERSTPGAAAPQARGTPSSSEAPADEVPGRQDAMRRAIGALMARSKHEIPHYYLQQEIDMRCALDWLHETNRTRTVESRLLPSALLLSAVAHAAADMPEMNGFWIEDSFTQGSGVHLGVAVSLRGGGLIAPALHDADRRTLDELMAGVRDLVQRARSGRLRSSEMSDPTLTVTNLGERGVDLVHGVIYPPQVALVGFGAIRERPWADAGMLGVRPTVIATLAADHRASDGHSGGRFLNLIDHRLQRPEQL